MIKLERGIVNNADAVTCVSPSIAEDFRMKISDNPKVRAIYNGYDETDFKEESQEISSQKYRMTFIGGLGKSQICANFFKALHLLPREIKEMIEVEFIGNIHNEIESLIERYDLYDTVSIEGYKPHNHVIRRIQSSELLLLFIARNTGEGVISGKFFEYLATGNEILAVVEGSNQNLKDLLTKCNAGIMKQYEDDFADYIKSKIENWHQGNRHYSNLAAISAFSRKRQTRELASLFDEL